MLFYFTFVFVSHKMSLLSYMFVSMFFFRIYVKFPKNIHNRKRQFYLNNMYPLVFFSFTFSPTDPSNSVWAWQRMQDTSHMEKLCRVRFIYIYIRSKRMVWKKKTHIRLESSWCIYLYMWGGMKHTQAHCILHPMPKTRASPPPTQSCKKP